MCMRHSARYRMGERPRSWRKRSSRTERDTAAVAASSATVHLRSGED